MQIKEFLNQVCEQIKYKPIRKEIAEELENHIKEAKENYILEGMNEMDAQCRAISQMGEAEAIGKKLNKIHKPKLDWKLLLIIIVVLGFSFLVTFTRANTHDLSRLGTNRITIIKFIVSSILGILLSIGVYYFDYRKLQKYANYFYCVATSVIIFTLLANTSVRGIPYLQIPIFNITIAPAIIAMPLYVIAFAGFLQNNRQSKIKISFTRKKYFDVNRLKIILLSVVSILLLKESIAITPAIILTIVYLVLGTIKLLEQQENRIKNITILWGIPIILLLIGTIIIFSASHGAFRINRIIGSFYPEIDPEGSGWQAMQQKQVIHSAKWIGSATNKSNALDIFEEGTNFAFISILAHYGWIISIGMVMAIVALNAKLILNAIKIKDMYGKMLIIGIATTFILQSMGNILMNLTLGIQADFNIPLISYGGSSLILNMVSLALTLSIYRRKNINTKQEIAQNESI